MRGMERNTSSKSSFADLGPAYEALVSKHFGTAQFLVGEKQVTFRKEESELLAAHGWTQAEWDEATRPDED